MEKQPDNLNSKSKKDKDYVPPKRKKKNHDCEDEEPIMVIDSDGNEVVEESEGMKELVRKSFNFQVILQNEFNFHVGAKAARKTDLSI